ncbi:hypothetical protein C8R46DRAFT_1273226 [Mycena filopes]|nr:hypothetical protein C8R46DRAFT_1273226 [Mycena filopes]
MDEDALPPASESATLVPDLWFPRDTPIVIRAEGKLFQVSRGILAARSTVFSDMFTLPQPAGGDNPKIDGSQVVDLPDLAEEVEVFLRAIFDSSYFMPAPAPIELSGVLGILRLSHKYDVQYLFRRALNHLAIDGWYRTAYDKPGKDYLFDITSGSPINALSVIAAAYEVGARWLLPSAYYFAATYSAKELLPFVNGKMGQYAIPSLAARSHLVRGAATIGRCLASPDPCPTRPGSQVCKDARIAGLSNLLDDFADIEWMHPIDQVWEAKTLKRLKAKGMCDTCRESVKNQLRAAATEFWQKVPSIFGLPSWEELSQMERAVMREEGQEENEEEEDEDEDEI